MAVNLRPGRLRRQYFALFLAASVLPVLLMGTISILSVQEALASRTAQDNEVLAQGAAAFVEERMREIASSAEDAAGDLALRSALENTSNGPELSAATLQVAARHPGLEVIGIALPTGEFVARFPDSATWLTGTNLSDETFVAVHTAPSTPYPTYVGGRFTPAAGGPSYIPVSTAVRNEFEEERGILVGFVSTARFTQVLTPLARGEQSAFLFDGGGKIIASAGVGSATVTADDLAAREQAIRPPGDSGNARSGGSDPQILAYAPAVVGSASWVVVLRQPLSAVFVQASPLLLFSALTVIATAAVATLVARLISSRTVEPVLALTEATKGLKAEKLPPELLARTDELGTLARAFAKMAAEVKAESESNLRLIERLKELDRLKSSLIDTVSHELRTPITIIRATAELLSMEAAGAETRTTKSASRIVRASDELAYLVEELIELGQLQAGVAVAQRTECDLNELVQQAVELEREAATRARLEIDLDLAPGLPPFRADRPKVRLVLRNIISNAVKFSNAGGRVAVVTREANGALEVRVRDEGTGISTHDLPRIFDPFFQVDSSVTRARGGAGIGLAIVKSFVDLHGGGVEVESELGKGSTFLVRFPLPAEGGPAGRGAR